MADFICSNKDIFSLINSKKFLIPSPNSKKLASIRLINFSINSSEKSNSINLLYMNCLISKPFIFIFLTFFYQAN